MTELEKLNPERVFHYFEEICAIPHGSGDMTRIAEYYMSFAEKNGLRAIRDAADNIVIFKAGSAGREGLEPIILQGHLDMVCQKVDTLSVDFEKDGIKPYVEDGFVKARGTSLGADNGIAVAMILAILESRELEHPPIEAVFTTDEEVGMVGALELDMSVFSGKRMINLDSEEEGVVTVSCAGGCDFTAKIPTVRKTAHGTCVTLTLRGLRGGHSGIEINGGAVNGDMLLGRVLDELRRNHEFEIVGICGGNKSNAIPNTASAELCVQNPDDFRKGAEEIFDVLKSELSAREPNFAPEVTFGEAADMNVLDGESRDRLIYALVCAPCGVMTMSAEIEGLVETSLNLGIAKTLDEEIELCFSLRSNKNSAMCALRRRLEVLFEGLGAKCCLSGAYPPWEYKENSSLRELFCRVYEEKCGAVPSVAAIHAGLECGVFSAKISGMDCISVGPEMFGVHTTEEKLSIASVERLFEMLKEILARLK